MKWWLVLGASTVAYILYRGWQAKPNSTVDVAFSAGLDHLRGEFSA